RQGRDRPQTGRSVAARVSCAGRQRPGPHSPINGYPGRRSATSRATYYLPRTMMLFGDAKDMVGQVVKELEVEESAGHQALREPDCDKGAALMDQQTTSGAGGTASEPGEDLNPFHIAAQQFDRAAAYLPGLKRGLIEFFKRPARTVIVEFPVELADGSV